MENSFLLDKLQGNFPGKINEIQDAHSLLTIVVDMEDVIDTQLIWLDNQHSHHDNPNLEFDKALVHQTIHKLQDFANSLPIYEPQNQPSVKMKP